MNLDIAPGFTAVAPVVGSSPTGSLTGQRYPDSLVQPDKHGFQPRIGVRLASDPGLVAGDSRRLRHLLQHVGLPADRHADGAAVAALEEPERRRTAPANPLTLANGFNAAPNVTPNTFAVDPNFRIGYAQNWQLSVQRDLPGALVVTATYLGIKGTRARAGVPAEHLSRPARANPCPACPSGFAYLTSNGNSTRAVRPVPVAAPPAQRLHRPRVQYTFSKAIDDAALGGKRPGRLA